MAHDQPIEPVHGDRAAFAAGFSDAGGGRARVVAKHSMRSKANIASVGVRSSPGKIWRQGSRLLREGHVLGVANNCSASSQPISFMALVVTSMPTWLRRRRTAL